MTENQLAAHARRLQLAAAGMYETINRGPMGTVASPIGPSFARKLARKGTPVYRYTEAGPVQVEGLDIVGRG